MKDFNQKTVLQRLRLHGVVELIRDRAAENAVRMGMDGVERSGGVLQLDLAVHEDVVVQNKADLLVLDIAALDHTGAAVQLQAAASAISTSCVTRWTLCSCTSSSAIRPR